MSWQIGQRNEPAYAKWNKGIQDRISEATATIAQMKGIRMIGLDKVISGYMQSLREREVRASLTARLLKVAYIIVCESNILSLLLNRLLMLARWSSVLVFVHRAARRGVVLDHLDRWT